MIFEGKYFSCYILLIDQISWPSYLYFMSYWEICVIIFQPGCDVTNFELTTVYLSNKAVFYMTKKSRQKIKCFENENSF